MVLPGKQDEGRGRKVIIMEFKLGKKGRQNITDNRLIPFKW